MNPIRSNLHTHTQYSDGLNTPEEYVLSAIGKGFVSLGFSEHNYTPYDGACCVKQGDMPAYFAEIRELKEKYSGQIELYLGLEGDYYYPTPVDEIDYFIGSIHYLRDEATGKYYTIDHLPEIFEQAVQYVGGGSVRHMVETYYNLVADLAQNQNPDIIGHLDLITKLNGENRYFDPTSDWYRKAAENAIDAIAAVGAIVEVNTGGIYRGYKTGPYPSADLLELLHKRNVPVTISSDAHQVDGLDFWFQQAAELLARIGYQSIMHMQGGAFVPVPLL